MRILITGGAGFIGSHTVDLLIERGHDVAVVDNLSSGWLWNLDRWLRDRHPLLRFVELDIAHTHALAEWCVKVRPDVIIHLAAQPSLRRSLDDPAFDATVNILGTLNVIAAARRHGVGHVVFASTSAVYAAKAKPPYREADRLMPDRPYGIAKAAAERYLLSSGLRACVLRYGNVYGTARQAPVGENQLWAHAMRGLLFGERFVIYGSGNQTRDFVHVRDVARANVVCVESGAVGVFNISTGVETSVNAVVRALCDAAGYSSDIPHAAAHPEEPLRVSLDPSRARRELGWEATLDVREGAKILVASWKEAFGAQHPSG